MTGDELRSHVRNYIEPGVAYSCPHDSVSAIATMRWSVYNGAIAAMHKAADEMDRLFAAAQDANCRVKDAQEQLARANRVIDALLFGE